MNRLFLFLAIICIGVAFSPDKKGNRLSKRHNEEKNTFVEGSLVVPKIVKVGTVTHITECKDTPITLTPETVDPEALYEWTDEEGNVLAVGTNYDIPSIDTTHTYTLTVYKADNTERVVNGGFESGNSSFTSDYGYVADIPGRTDELHPEGKYGVGTNPNNYHGSFANMSDHSGSGNMMVINAGSLATDIVWYQQIDISANTKYAFSFWGSSVHPTNPAILSFYLSDGKLTPTEINDPATYRIGDAVEFSLLTDHWVKYFKIWDSKSFTGQKYISVVNSNTIASGNDFAIDDISFTGTTYEHFDIRVEVVPTISGGIDTETIPSVCEGEEITLNMSVTGSANSYVWKKGTADITNDKNFYKLTNPVVEDSGTYTCTVESICGSVTKTFNVTVNKNIQTKMINNKKP